MRRAVVAGNWKMNGSRASVEALVSQLVSGFGAAERVDMLLFPSYVYLEQVRAALAESPIRFGAQNLSEHEAGAYTGEVAPAMLKEFGCGYVLVGHSERRSLYAENDEMVAAKYASACQAGLVPVLCVGETLEEREAQLTLEVVGRQIRAVSDLLGARAFDGAIIAYEPVWAIGTGLTATPEQAQEVHAAIRRQVAELDAESAAKLPILYGGSVNAGNAKALFAMADIDGGLVGGASLKAEEFLSICRAAEEVYR